MNKKELCLNAIKNHNKENINLISHICQTYNKNIKITHADSKLTFKPKKPPHMGLHTLLYPLS